MTSLQDFRATNVYAYALGDPIDYNDPRGEFINIAIGAAIGGLGNFAYQLWKYDGNISCVDPWEVAKWAALGGLTGVLVPEGLLARGGLQTVTHWRPEGAGGFALRGLGDDGWKLDPQLDHERGC
jgi:hypothetical protein